MKARDPIVEQETAETEASVPRQISGLYATAGRIPAF
jgi:hypothetical protein